MSWLKGYSFWVFWLLLGVQLNAQYDDLDISFTADAESLLMPLTGGFTSPQFSNIDLNRDGVQDMVVFDRDGNVFRSFIYEEAADEFRYAPEYNSNFPDARNFVLIRDFNGDGVEDLFTFSHLPGIAGVQVFRGLESGSQLMFEPVTFSNHRDIIEYENSSGSYTNAYVSSIDLPVLDDVDGDGDIDLLSWEPSGSYIYFYRNMAVERNYTLDSLVFTLSDRCWGKVFESEFSETLILSDNPNACSQGILDDGSGAVNLRHAGSTITLRDLTANGLQDILIGDIGSNKITALFNGGTPSSAFGVEQDANFPSSDKSIDFNRFIATFFLDLNNDGKDEMIAAPNSAGSTRNQNFIWRYDNDLASDTSGFSPQFIQENFLEELTLDLSGHSVPSMADVNQDGLLDLVVGTQGVFKSVGGIEPRLYLFINTGTASQPAFRLEDSDYLSLSNYPGNQNQGLAPAFGDLDGDGDIDLVVGSFSGGVFYFENQAGSGEPFAFSVPIEGFADIDVGQFSIPQIVDVNGDGLADLIMGERNGNSLDGMACGNVNYFQNIGSVGDPQFMAEEDEAPNTPCLGDVFTRTPTAFTGYSSPQLLPADNGFLLLTGSQSREILLYEGEGILSNPMNLIEEKLGDLKIGTRTHPRFYDINNDGVYELIVGNSRGGLQMYSTPYLVSGSTSNPNGGIGELKVDVYPNPGTDYFYLKGDLSQVDEVAMWSSDGKWIRSWDKPRQTKFQCSSVSSGMYILVIKSSKEVVVKRWMKQ